MKNSIYISKNLKEQSAYVIVLGHDCPFKVVDRYGPKARLETKGKDQSQNKAKPIRDQSSGQD